MRIKVVFRLNFNTFLIKNKDDSPPVVSFVFGFKECK